MIVFKSCVRCRGDVHVKDDQYGKYLDCLQCGATTEIVEHLDATTLSEIA